MTLVQNEVSNELLYAMHRAINHMDDPESLKCKLRETSRYIASQDGLFRHYVNQCMKMVMKVYRRQCDESDVRIDALQVMMDQLESEPVQRVCDQFRDDLIIQKMPVLDYEKDNLLVVQDKKRWYITPIHEIRSINHPEDVHKDEHNPFLESSCPLRLVTIENAQGHPLPFQDWDNAPVRRKIIGVIYGLPRSQDEDRPIKKPNVTVKGWSAIGQDWTEEDNINAIDFYTVSYKGYDIGFFRHPDMARAFAVVTEKKLQHQLHPYFMEKFDQFLTNPYHPENAMILDVNSMVPENYVIPDRYRKYT